MIDVLIQTFEEELNLPHTLRSLEGWARKVFVVDSGSADATREIAEAHGAEFVEHAWEGYAGQKNWALANLPFEAEWTLILDADEAVTPELKRHILEVTDRDPDDVEEAGYYLNRRFIFNGRPIRHCGYFPSWNLRLFKRGRAHYEDRLVHEHMIVDGPVAYLEGELLHEDRRGLEHFFAKHNRYSTLEARQMWESTDPWPGWGELGGNRIARVRFIKNHVLPRVPFAWVMRFIYMYILRLGVLDGRAGLSLSTAIALYEYMVQAKYRELVRLDGEVPRSSALVVAEGKANVHTVGDGTLARPRDAAALNGDRPAIEGRNPDRIPVTRAHRRQTQRVAQLGDEGIAVKSPWTLRQNIGRVLWMFSYKLLFRPSFHNWYGWRRLILRTFGARIGESVRVRPTARIEIPWNVDIGDHAIIGDDAILYSLGPIKIGRRVVISQYAHLCAGTHDFTDDEFPLLRPPVTVEDEAWIAADAFVGPGVTIGRRAILGARSSAFKDIPPGKIAGGNPARPIRDRDLAPPTTSAEPAADSSPEVAAEGVPA